MGPTSHHHHHPRTSSSHPAAAIPFPHDGPIHQEYQHRLRRRRRLEEDEEEETITSKSREPLHHSTEVESELNKDHVMMEGCLQLLLLSFEDNDDDESNDASRTWGTSSLLDDDDDIPIRQLVVTLRSSSHLAQQLQALQKFRNLIRLPSLSSRHDHRTTESTTTTNTTTTDTIIRILPLTSPVFLYRLLLEWMISRETTPVTLRRVVASCLSVLLHIESERHCIWNLVLASIVKVEPTMTTTAWAQPLWTLQELVSWAAPRMEWWWYRRPQPPEPRFTDHDEYPITTHHDVLAFVASQAHLPISEQKDDDPTTSITNSSSSSMVAVVDQITLVAQITHHLIHDPHGRDNSWWRSTLRNYLWQAIQQYAHVIPRDRLSNIGIAHGRTLGGGDPDVAPPLATVMEQIWTLPSALQRVTILQGLAVMIPLRDLTLLEDLLRAFRVIVEEECDPDVRCFAVQGLRTVTSRIQTTLSTHDNTATEDAAPPPTSPLPPDAVRRIAEDVLSVVLVAWENPSTRKLANAIPALFDSVIQVMMKSSMDLEELVERILAQPPHLKGRYLALEILMPITGVTRFVPPTSSSTLLDDLLVGIGDHGHNTGVMADLWAKLLRQLRMELKEQNQPTIESPPGTMDEQLWWSYWVPSLTNALISSDLTRRKQIAAFCLPRIASMEIRASAPRIAAAPTFDAILTSVQAASAKASARYYKSVYRSTESHHDRTTWAVLEVIRYAAMEGLLKPTLGSIHLREKVTALVPEHRLRSMLTHSSMTIRSSAFKAMDSILSSYGGTVTTLLESVRLEADLWKYALPYSIKTDGKEFTLSLLQCLLLFLDRLSIAEESSLQNHEIPELPDHVMPIFHDFVVEFLLFDVALKKTGYPGTVALKEAFLFQLLECLIVFCSREHPLAKDSKLLPKSAAVFRRRRLDREERAIDEVKKALLSQEVFECCLSMLHSTWDSARNNFFRIIMSLVHLGKYNSIAMPLIYVDVDSRIGFLRRGVYLASSPRQREADTGAKLLAFLFVALRNEYEKVEFLEKLVDLLDQRLILIKQKLVVILSCNDKTGHEKLPLAHGIVHALRLIIESDDDKVPNNNDCPSTAIQDAVDRIILHLLEAIRISLSVVADVKDGQIIDGMDEDMVSEIVTSRTKSARMVNPSAIGANGIFSSVTRISDAENVKRLASQRIIVGSWLLTKETCGALAAVLSKSRYNVSCSLYCDAGTLLISTLTSLKHTGAAFAAHRALQTIAQSCFSASHDLTLNTYPEKWMERIVVEVSTLDKIRDSTLRRSTGYSLTVLSLMRAEGIARTQHSICRSFMMRIVSLCLPSKTQSDIFANKMQLTEELQRSLYSIPGGQDMILQENIDNVRTRVHALNILRSILLDAPLARDVYPFVGIALIASVIGYTDTEWSVRNSSTMVFAAAMLRSIDSDKNASNKDVTGRNPITIYELFRSYPSLRPFLLALLKGSVQGLFTYHHALSIPPVLPILLLLSRLNPVSKSGHDSMVQGEPFIPELLQLLRNKELIIRKHASNALRNLASLDNDSTSSVYDILLHCQGILFSTIKNGADGDQWNHVHGILLTIRELAKTFHEAKSWLNVNSTKAFIAAISKLYGGSIIPPSCLSVSLEISWILIQSQDINYLHDLCSEVIAWLSKVDQQNFESIGSTELAAQAATILVDIGCSIIWDESLSFQKKEVCVDQLSLLLHSDCIDVRIAATKSFKKSLSYNFARLEISEDSQKTIEILAFALLSALERELSRDGCDNGPHCPTLRRLSRCLVAICCQSVTNRDIEFPKRLRLKSTCMGWLLLNLTAYDCDPGLLTLSQGNALEMISAELESTCQNRNERLLVLTNEYSNPVCNWRVRLSAANTLQMLVQVSEGAFSMFGDFRLLQSWIALIQDEDCDVRNAAVSVSRGINELTTPSIDVTELAFIHDMERVSVSAPTHETMQGLLRLLFQLCEKSIHEVDSTIEEIFDWNRTGPFATITNVGTSRLIFESDAANSYHEKCFVCQIIAATILQMHLKSPFILKAGPVLDATNECLKCTKTMLSRILECLFSDSSLHDVTHSRIAFPSLHNQIVATLTLICIFGCENLMIQEIQLIASKIVNATKEGSAAWLVHPILAKALCVLASDKTRCMNTTIPVLDQCCFLLSQNRWNQ